MSDYLWNVAARALGRATVVRPRLAPLFGESDLSPAWPDVDLWPDVASTTEAPPTSEQPMQSLRPQSLDGRPAQVAQPALLAPGVHLESTPQAVPPPMQTATSATRRKFGTEPDAQVQLAELETPLTRPVHRLPGEHKQNVLAPRELTAVFPFPASPPFVDSRVPPHALQSSSGSGPNRSPEPGASVVATPWSVERRQAQPPSQPEPSATPVGQPDATEKTPARRSRAIQVDVARVTVPPRDSRGTTPAPAPSIQVTIGRIEVRATPALPPTRMAASPPTSSSLEEYLKRRAQGGGA